MTTNDQQMNFTDDEIFLKRANATATALGMIRYVRVQSEASGTAVRWLSNIFVPGWKHMRQQGVQHVARQMALNLVSVGASLRELSGGAHRAEMTVPAWPGSRSSTPWA